MAFCPEHPKRDQNLKLTPLSETTSIPAPSIWESPPPGDECSHSESHCNCSARRDPGKKMKNKKKVCTKCFEKEILQMLNCVPGVHMNKPTKWLLSSQRIKSSFHHGTMVFKSFPSTLYNVVLFIMVDFHCSVGPHILRA